MMGAAIVLYVGLALYLTRGSVFYSDNLRYFAESGDISPGAILTPYEGHLTASVRLLYELNLRLFGPETLPFQVETILLSALSAALVFLLARRWCGPVLALPIALVLLVLGSTPDTVQSYAIMWPLSVAAGLGALLTLTGHERRRDWLACSLLVVSVLSLEIGLAFAVAAAVLLVARPKDRVRLWVAAVPVVVYGAWWLWAQRFDDPSLASFSNLQHLPYFAFNSLASGITAFTGIAALHEGSDLQQAAEDWGRPLAAVFIALVVFAGVRRDWSRQATAAAAFLATFIAAGTLSYIPVYREPTTPRYVYPIVIGMILLFAAVSPGLRRSKLFWGATALVCGFAIVANLSLLKDQAAGMRTIDGQVEAGLASIELERDLVPEGFAVPFRIPDGRGYLEGEQRWGSLTYPSSQLGTQSAADRQAADRVLGDILQPQLVALPPHQSCSAQGAETGEVQLPTGGGGVTSAAGGPVLLRRFGDHPAVSAGKLAPGVPAAIEIPADGSAAPWYASSPGGIALCSAT